MRMLLVLQAGPWGDLVSRVQSMGAGAERASLTLAAALLVMLVGWLLATILSRLVRALLRALPYNHTVRRLLGIGPEARHEPAGVVGWAINWLILIIAALLALDVLGFDLSASVSERLADVVPRIITSGLLFAVGALVAISFGGLTRRFLETAGARTARLRGQIVTLVLTGFAVLIALEQLGFAAQFVMILAIVAVAAVGLALGLAFGLGCRELARDFVVEYLRSLDEEGPERSS